MRNLRCCFACKCGQVGSLDFTGIVAGRKAKEEAEAAERAEMEWKRKKEEAEKVKDDAEREEKRKIEEDKKKRLADDRAERERKVREEVERKKLQQEKLGQDEAATAAAAEAAKEERGTQQTLVEADELVEAPSLNASTAVESVGEQGHAGEGGGQCGVCWGSALEQGGSTGEGEGLGEAEAGSR